MEYIQLHTKENFKTVMNNYQKKHSLYMWDHFKSETCYIPAENCFISLQRAKEKGGREIYL